MNKVFLSHAFNKKESDYIQLLKNELELHGVQIYETNHLEIKDDIISAIHDPINTCELLIAFMIIISMYLMTLDMQWLKVKKF